MKRLSILLAVLCCGLTSVADPLVWYDGEHPVTYSVQGTVAPVVNQALQMFCSDMEMVTGRVPVAARALRQLWRLRGGMPKKVVH